MTKQPDTSMVEQDDYVLWFGEQALELRQYKSEYQKLALDLGNHKGLVQKLNESLSEIGAKLKQAEDSYSAKDANLVSELKSKYDQCRRVSDEQAEKLKVYAGRINNLEQELIGAVAEIATLQTELSAKAKKPKKKVKK